MVSLWFRHVLRVRYQETDQMGIVYHANYANWFEVGRTEMIRQAGMPYADLERRGILLPVTELSIRFHKPARYDDVIAVYTRIAGFTGIRMEMENELRKVEERFIYEPPATGSVEQPEGDLLVTGGTRHVWLDRDWRPLRIDKAAPDLYALLTRFAGKGE